MQQEPEQSGGAPGDRKPGKGCRKGPISQIVHHVGQKGSDGALTYPKPGVTEVAAALCLQPNTKGTQAVYDLTVEAISARPEFANMRMYSTKRTANHGAISELINSGNLETQELVRSDTLPSTTHKDPEQMTNELIYARLMWKLRNLLEQNITARQAIVPPLDQDQPLEDLAVPKMVFRESSDTWWKLMRHVLNWLVVAFSGKSRFSTESNSAEGRLIRAAVHQYRKLHGIAGNSQHGSEAAGFEEDNGEKTVDSVSQNASPAKEEDVVQCSPS